MKHFQGKTYAITGASRGIGRALAIALAERGSNVVLGARDQAALQSTQSDCETAAIMSVDRSRPSGEQARSIAVPLDVTHPESCEAFINAGVNTFGQLDCLVNNAGISLIANYEDITDLTTFEAVMRVNFLGAVYCSHFALPHLKNSQGLLVGISSLCGKIGVPTRSGYVASKHAMQGFFDTLRIELAGSGVDVLVVSPGYVATEIRSRALDGQGKVLGTSNRDETKGTMSVEACTNQILQGMAARKREVVMTTKGKFIPWMKVLAPGLLDWIVRQAT